MLPPVPRKISVSIFGEEKNIVFDGRQIDVKFTA
jgi:hypothetical protein